jgi:hypothetical protein
MPGWLLTIVMMLVACLVLGVFFYFGQRGSRAQAPAPPKVTPRERIHREFAARHVPSQEVPPPLPLAEDAVGGIESITIAGKRYWFGFSHSADAVLSPLIDDSKVMAQFASDYMLQRDVEDAERREIACPPEYWDKLVEEAIHGSELTDSARDYTGHELTELRARLEEARRTARPVGAPPTTITHLFYLLGATGDLGGAPEDPELEDALGGVAAGDWFEGALRVVSGASPPPSGTTVANAAGALIAQLEHWRSVTPENWKSLLFRGHSGH